MGESTLLGQSSSKLKLYKKSTELDFGKYKGRKVKWVLNRNPQYLHWCIHHVGWFYVNKSLKKAINKRLLSIGYDSDYVPPAKPSPYYKRPYTEPDDYDYDDPFLWDQWMFD